MRLLRGQTLDVDAALNGISPETFDEWVALEEIDPDPLERITEVLKLGFATLCAVSGFGVQIDPDELDPVTRKREEDTFVSPNEAAKILGGVYGF